MNDDATRGFTLVELLVSLAILSIALAVLFGAISNSLDRTRKGRDEAVAVSLVQSLLARAGAARPLDAGETGGVYSNGYRWRLVVRPYGDGDDVKARQMSAFTLRASVSWQDGGRTQSRTLSALRLVPLPPQQP